MITRASNKNSFIKILSVFANYPLDVSLTKIEAT